VDQDVARDRPDLEVVDQDRTSTRLEVPDAPEAFWLVFGQSFNPGWRATADGEDLGPPTLVNGFANGWLVPAGTDIELQVTWVPQRTVTALLGLSLGFVVLAIALAAWPRGRPHASPGEPLGAAMPSAWTLSRVLRYEGPAPSPVAALATVAAAVVAGWATIGVGGAVVLGVAALVTLRVSRARALLTVGGPLLFVAAVVWMAARQASENLPAGFGWPGYFEGAQDPAWLSVLLIALDVVVDRCWSRRWWPGDGDDR
jgi:arabinofuranan 3-O-arabinosyltransferase